HLIAQDDKHAMALAARLLSYLPANNVGDPPHDLDYEINTTPDPGMNELVPGNPKQALDVLQIIDRLVDPESFMEIMPDFAKNLVVGFARICAVAVGIIANHPAVRAGTLDIDSSDKGARFIRTCNIFNIPVVNLVDTPGFMPGLAQERGGIIRHGAK